jgi:Lrp/AsnC family transcriptional regulator, leucine-responsive regulatory protein
MNIIDMYNLHNEGGAMDSVDARLLELLQEDSRMKVSELSQRLNLSRPSVSDRMSRLRDSGVIEGYSARVSLKAVGRPTLLIIHLSSLKVSPRVFEARIADDTDILECHRVTGEIDYIIKAAVPDMDEMRALIDRLLPFGDVSTSIVLLSPIPYRNIVPKIDD